MTGKVKFATVAAKSQNRPGTVCPEISFSGRRVKEEHEETQEM